MNSQSLHPSSNPPDRKHMASTFPMGMFLRRPAWIAGRSWAQRLAAIVAIALLTVACSSTEEAASVVTAQTAATVENDAQDVAATASVPAPTVENDAQDVSAAASVPAPTATSTPTPTVAPEPTPEPTVEPEPAPVDCSAVGEVAVGLQTGSFLSNGVEWEYQWTVPSSYDDTPIPVVLDFHGFASSAALQARYVGWPELAEAEGFLAVQPQGQGFDGSPRLWALPQFTVMDDREDAEMVRDLLDHIAANVCVDPARIYSTGFSMGGSFTSVLICELGDVIAAAVSVGGVHHHESCQPTRPVPYLAFHGTRDNVVRFEGQDFPPDANDERKFISQSQPGEFAEFADDFNCSEAVDSQVSESVTLTSYIGCEDDIEMGFYAIEGGGHTWPGAVAMDDDGPFGVRTMEVDASAIAWEFFQRNPLPS